MMKTIARTTAALLLATFAAGSAHAMPMNAADAVSSGSAARLVQFQPKGSFASPKRRAEVDCNGKTTSQCCQGLSYCSCLYMPGSDSTHPTACFANPPPKPKG